jgi:glycolate oxidase FAD binding subunit
MKPSDSHFSRLILDQLLSLDKRDFDLLSWKEVNSSWHDKILQATSGDETPYFLIFPQTVTSLTQIVTLAYENRCNLMPAGNASKLNWGGLAKNIHLVVSTNKLNRFIEHGVEDLVVTVQSGVKLADLQKQLRAKNQFLPIDPTYPDSATVGGIIATADTGSWRQRYGGIRDLVLGLSFVRHDGKIAKAGGKVVKNVAGYDLMKLFTGSYGTLGIITQATFRVYPIPEHSSTVVIAGDSDNIAKARQVIVSSTLTPTAADLLSPSVLKSLELGLNMGLMIRFQSIRESVTQQIRQVESLAKELNLKVSLFESEREEYLWQNVKELITIPHSDSAITCKIGLLPSQAVNLFNQVDVLGTINISTGLGRLYFPPENSLELIQKTRRFCHNNQGFLSILESPVMVKEKLEPWGYQENAIAVMQKLKNKFDPQNIFNSGKILDTLKNSPNLNN